jgi:hypothetical protein
MSTPLLRRYALSCFKQTYGYVRGMFEIISGPSLHIVIASIEPWQTIPYSRAIFWEAEELGEGAVTQATMKYHLHIKNTLQEWARRDMSSRNKEWITKTFREYQWRVS